MKTCLKCNTTKPLDDFYTNNQLSDRKTTWCKDCCRAKEKATHKKDPWKKKFYEGKIKYGSEMTREKFTHMLEEQSNQCGICQKEMLSPYIDHDHSTGKIRMLLCHHCNSLLGMAKDNKTILQGAIRYLEKFQ